MTICFVSREFIGSKRAGGIASYIYDIAKALIAEGHKVIVLSASDNIFKSERILVDDIDLIKLSGADYFLHSNSFIQYIGTRIRSYFYFNSYRKKVSKTLEYLHKEVDIDLVEFPEYGNEANFWLRRKGRKIPTVIRFHGIAETKGHKTIINLENRKIRNLLITASKADNISFPSYAMLNLLLDSGNFSKKLFEKFQFSMRIIPNATIFKESNRIPTSTKDQYIFTAGSFCKGKGFTELIEAVKLLNEKQPQYQLLIAGKLGKLGKYYLKLSKSHHLYKDWLIILGPLDRKKLYGYYANAELCCFPSYWESFGLTCTEAMSVGGLVLGSSAGGMFEIITEGEDGFLIAPQNIQKLQKKIEEILNLDSQTKDQLKMAAKMKVRNNFSEKVVAKEMVSYYKSVIQEFHTAL